MKTKGLKAKLAGLALAGAVALGVLISGAEGGHATSDVVGQGRELASAAQQLDNLTQGGGPTAAMNQKIQEVAFLAQVERTTEIFGNDALKADNQKQQEEAS